jgi:hypothetical protein
VPCGAGSSRVRTLCCGVPVGKGEAPRAVLLVETSAPPGAAPSRGDPPLIDHPELPFVTTNVNRPSECALRRAIPIRSTVVHIRLPICGVPPTGGTHPHLARLSRSDLWQCRLLGGSCARASLVPDPGRCRLFWRFSRGSSSSVPDPGGLGSSVGPPEGVLPVSPTPFPEPRSACATRCDSYSARCITPGQAVFSNSQGCPPRNPEVPKSGNDVHREPTGLSTPPAPTGRSALTFRPHPGTINSVITRPAFCIAAIIIIP